MKFHMIVGKKQLALASLILILGVAVYINWSFADTEGGSLAVGAPGITEENKEDESEKNYGEAELVNGNTESEDFFAKARLEKQTSRDEAVATLAKMFGDTSADSEQVKAATDKALTTAKTIESESKMETLIRSKGFEDCVVYLSDQSAKVIVQSDGLEAAEAARIMEIVVSESEVPSENISIVEVK